MYWKCVVGLLIFANLIRTWLETRKSEKEGHPQAQCPGAVCVARCFREISMRSELGYVFFQKHGSYQSSLANSQRSVEKYSYPSQSYSNHVNRAPAQYHYDTVPAALQSHYVRRIVDTLIHEATAQLRCNHEVVIFFKRLRLFYACLHSLYY